MKTEEMLRNEIRRLYALEGGLVSVFDQLDGRTCSRKVAVSIIMLIESSDRHLADLDRICAEEGWTTDGLEHSTVEAWRTEVESQILSSSPDPATDALCVALLRRAVHLRIPCYESARLFAFYAERPQIARTLRLALEDEYQSLERLRSAAELGVSLRTALGEGPFAAN